MLRWWTALGAMLVIGAGCATHLEQPALSGAVMTPNNLTPGDAALITVVVDDKFNIVDRIEGKVLEDTTIQFKFRDDGTKGDVVGGDSVWTTKVEAPFNAPPGDFTFEISAYDSDNNLIVVTDENKEAAPLSTTIALVITFPDTVIDDEASIQ